MAESPLPQPHPLEVSQSPETLIASAQWENFTPQTGSISGAIAHWGVNTNNSSLATRFAQMGLKITEEDIANTGFTNRFLYPNPTTMQEAAVVEEIIGAQLIQNACRNRGIEPGQLALVGVANSFPYYNGSTTPSFAREIANTAGAGTRETMDVQLLCNGSMELLRQVALRQKELEGQYVAIGSVEGLGKVLTADTNHKQVDPANLQIFSNVAGMMVFEVGEDIIFTNAGAFRYGQDEQKTIIGSQFFPFPDTMNPGDICHNQTSIRQCITHPPDGDMYASMNPGNTLKWVVRVIRPMLIEILNEQYPNLGPDESIPLIGHVPSQVIHQKLVDWAGKAGFPLDAPTYVPDGNGSSATSMKQLLRASTHGFFDNEREVLAFAYGLGWNASWLKMMVPQHF